LHYAVRQELFTLAVHTLCADTPAEGRQLVFLAFQPAATAATRH